MLFILGSSLFRCSFFSAIAFICLLDLDLEYGVQCSEDNGSSRVIPFQQFVGIPTENDDIANMEGEGIRQWSNIDKG